MDKLDELDKFLERHKLQKHLQEEIYYLNILKSEFIVKNILIMKIPHPDNFTAEFYQILKAERIPILPKFLHRK